MMWFKRLLSLLLLCIFNPLASANNWKLQTRIVGGDSAVVKQFPYQVSLRYKSDHFHFCGGSIFHSQFILSAAHCFIDPDNQLSFIYGLVNVTHFMDQGVRIDFHTITIHPFFEREYNPDIALIRTKESIVYSEFVKPVNLPNQYHIEPGTLTLIAGWGFTEVSFFSNIN